MAGYGAYCVTRDPKNVKISLCKCFTPVKKKKKEVTEVPVIVSLRVVTMCEFKR